MLSTQSIPKQFECLMVLDNDSAIA